MREAGQRLPPADTAAGPARGGSPHRPGAGCLRPCRPTRPGVPPPARPPPPTHADAGGSAAVLGAAVAVEAAALVAGQQRGAALAALPGADQAAGTAVQHGRHPRGAARRLGRAAPAAGPRTRRLPAAHLRGQSGPRGARSRGRPGRRLPPTRRPPPGAPHLPGTARGGGAAGRAGAARRPSPWSRPPPPRRAARLCRQSHCSRLYRRRRGPPSTATPAPPAAGSAGRRRGAGAGPGAPLPPLLPPPAPAGPHGLARPGCRRHKREPSHPRGITWRGDRSPAGRAAPFPGVGPAQRPRRGAPPGGGCRPQPDPTGPLTRLLSCRQLPHELETVGEHHGPLCS